MSEISKLPWSISKIHAIGMYGTEGEVSITCPDEDRPRVLTVDCRTKYKRGQGHAAKCAERDANAAYIVKCCNAYPALVEALKRALEHLPSIDALPRSTKTKIGETLEIIHAALAQAEQKEQE